MMSKILHIDASVRAAINPNPKHSSISKNIANRLINSWKKQVPIDEYIYRDVGMNPPPFITQDWIEAVFTPENKRTHAQCNILSISDQLIAEVSNSDILVISSPMYNYGMPAQLKAWFDQIIRINKTFDFDLARGDFPLQPLLSGKILIIITSSGEFGFEKDGIRQNMSHLVPHICTLSKYLGVEKIYEISSEYQEFGDERHIKSLENAFQKAEKLVAQLSSLYTKS
ncbi:NAD(P)H-dependent oxidoreductase [Acinetobacter pittii]|uniref:FMN-dependent NADH-azoreductase n=1 Tax=Acinetobacter pittii TaxID=48296 RepID=UPI001C22D158|nr:NAD(P)H-dependent oxidoreductase [Acinetobacter pittii]QXA09118.1 NAD(P)H-dependent oxidoreductase [Acinetobacter pittii]